MPRDESSKPQGGELRVDLNGASAAVVGAQAGIDPSVGRGLATRLGAAIAQLEDERMAGHLPFLDVAQRKDALAATRATADALRPGTDTLVVLGGGGAARGVSALAAALADHPRRGREGAVGLVVLDSLDPAEVDRVLSQVDLERTAFHVISAGGSEPDTMAQFLVVRDRLIRKFGALDYTRRLLVTTDAGEGGLRQLVREEGLPASEFPSGLRERFAALCPELLLGSEMMGVDNDALLAGAAAMQERVLRREVLENPAAMLAGALYLLEVLHGGVVHMLMPWAARLWGMANWWSQLWAASLGKRFEEDGTQVALGPTPVRGTGASEHSSQLQMLLDGPADKVVLFVRTLDHGMDAQLPKALPGFPEAAPLAGRGLGELLDAHQLAAEVGLARRGRPSVRIDLPALTPHSMGELMLLLETSVVILARLHGVDPFSSPAAATVQQRALALLGGPGAEDARAEVDAWRRGREGRWIL